MNERDKNNLFAVKDEKSKEKSIAADGTQMSVIDIEGNGKFLCIITHSMSHCTLHATYLQV